MPGAAEPLPPTSSAEFNVMALSLEESEQVVFVAGERLLVGPGRLEPK